MNAMTEVSFAAPRILVVDDESFNLEIINEYLSETGYDLTFRESGEAAWAALDEPGAVFDIIVLDRIMPGMSGIELLQRIKADPRHAHVPVIMQTAAAAPEQVREGLEAGAYYYLTKPFVPESLLSIVRAALDLAAERDSSLKRTESVVDALQLAKRGEFELRTLKEARDLAVFAARLCPEPDLAVLGLSEVLTNAIEHGNLGISYNEKSRLKHEDRWEEEIERRLALPEYAEKRAILAFERSPTELVFTIRDCGDGFDWKPYLDLDPSRAFDPNGRGIALARNISFSRMEYRGTGSEVMVAVALPGN
ncbi:MAG: response regulator [Rhodocyclaceae bacterium]